MNISTLAFISALGRGRWSTTCPGRFNPGKEPRHTIYRRMTSIYQPTNAHIISHKTPLKHSDMFRSYQSIMTELCYLLKLCNSIRNSIRIRKRGVVAAYRVV